VAKPGAKISPFAPTRLPDMPVVPGVRLAACEAGIRYQNRTDLMVAVLDPGTGGGRRADPVQDLLGSGAVVPGRACRTARHGRWWSTPATPTPSPARKAAKATRLTAEAAAKAFGCAANEVYVASTGVIGEPLDAGKFTHLLQGLTQSAVSDAFLTAARAIMTTDTYTKLATRTVRSARVPVTINAFCKGAGMIAPDMATMLCFIFTDAAIAQPALQALLSKHVATTFNCMTVDGDTSTSDTCLLFATGAAAKRGQQTGERGVGCAPRGVQRGLARGDARPCHAGRQGRRGPVEVRHLRDQRGGELGGGAQDCALVRQLADPEAAIAGEDPNWGRVVMAVGKSGEAADRDKLSIWFGPHLVAKDGERAPGYVEKTVAAYMQGKEIVIRADVGVGRPAPRCGPAT
jgi:glutamate N-acetyltransferase/amino-acid N-acetyltransferase